MAEPLWNLLVVGNDTSKTAVLAIQPRDQQTYEAVAPRMRRGGAGRITGREFEKGLWPLSAGMTVVMKGDVVSHLHVTGSTILATGHVGTSGLWRAAADERGRVLALLVPADTWDDEVDGEGALATADRINKLAVDRKLLGGLAAWQS